jgi:hypothetical protein
MTSHTRILLDIKQALDDLLLPYKIDLSLRHQLDNPQLIEPRTGAPFRLKWEARPRGECRR